MADENKDASKDECCAHGSCSHHRCGGCKFFAGLLVGLLLAGTALGIFLAGRCHSHHMCGMHKSMCPFEQQMQPQTMPMMPARPGKK